MRVKKLKEREGAGSLASWSETRGLWVLASLLCHSLNWLHGLLSQTCFLSLVVGLLELRSF